MVALLNKRQKKAAEVDPLTKAEAQLADLRAEMVKARARLAEVHFELDALSSQPDQRAQQITDLRAALSKAQADERGQEGYCSLLGGHSGEEELARLRTLITELVQQVASVEAAQLLAAKERQSRETELRAELATLERSIAETDSKIRTILSVKERLTQERGATIKAERDTVMSKAATLKQECIERLAEANRVEAQARAETFTALEEYPQHRRELASKHRLKSDATSEALEAAIQLLTILAHQAYEINQARAGYPHGVDGMLAEFCIDANALQAASVGDIHPLEELKFRVEGVHRAYLRNLMQM
jgi:predicted  nucleic acid-binding Zn-ribbon protein